MHFNDLKNTRHQLKIDIYLTDLCSVMSSGNILEQKFNPITLLAEPGNSF